MSEAQIGPAQILDIPAREPGETAVEPVLTLRCVLLPGNRTVILR